MHKILRATLIALLSNVILLFVNVQPLVSGDCSDGVMQDNVQVLRLEHAQPVTLAYQPGQRVTLAGNDTGTADLAGRSVVGIQFEPSGQMVGYGVETLPPVDITPLLYAGSNTVSLTAVDPLDMAWIRVTPPCPATQQTAIAPAAAPTATRVLIPTPTPVSVSEDAIIPPTPAVMHTAEAVNTGKTSVPVADADEDTPHPSFMPVLGRILFGLALLGLMLVFTMSDLYRLRDELLRLVEWCKRQEWSAMLAHVMPMDAAQFAAWRRRQELRLRAKYDAVKAELLDRYYRLDWDALVTRWNAVKAQLLAWLKRLG